MNYILMNKNNPVVQLVIDESAGHIEQILEIYNKQYIPTGIKFVSDLPDKSEFNEWWKSRSIPSSRDGLKDVLKILDLVDSKELITKSLGLSLSDQYWVKPYDKDIQWEDVNFFQNKFSKDVGEAILGHQLQNKDAINFMSPDNTSDGWLKKKWIANEDQRFLVKSGSGPFYQEPFNEVLASRMIARLDGFPCVGYDIYKDSNNKPYSICKNFITEDTELVPAYWLYRSIKKFNHHSTYDHLVRCGNEFNIPNFKEYLDFTLLCDYVIVNSDRHLNNLGVIRNANTLKIVSPAPIFDNGTSLWHNVSNSKISAIGKHESRPFKDTHEEQVKLVKSFSQFDVRKLKGLDEEFNEILKGNSDVDNVRRDLLCKCLAERINMLEKHIEKSSKQGYSR